MNATDICPVDRFRRLDIPQPAFCPEPFTQPTAVYVFVDAHGATLINTGHESSVPQLLAGLAGLRVAAGDVRQVMVTGAWPDLYGGIGAFPDADIFVWAPKRDPQEALDEAIAEVRARFEAAAAAWGGRVDARIDGVEDLLERYLTPAPRVPRMVALHDAQEVELAGMRGRARPVRGSVAAGVMFYIEEQKWLFSADLVQSSAEAAFIYDAAAYLESIAAEFDYDIGRIFPNRGVAPMGGRATLKRASLFANNFVANAAHALKGPTSAVQMVARDLGKGDVFDVEVVALALGHHTMLEELVRLGLVERTGEGLTACYSLPEGSPGRIG